MKIVQRKIVFDREFFGKVVRTYREDAGLTQGEVAILVGLSVAFVSAVERGVPDALTVRTLEKLINALDIPIWDLGIWAAE